MKTHRGIGYAKSASTENKKRIPEKKKRHSARRFCIAPANECPKWEFGISE
jgi:hypothetical protein